MGILAGVSSKRVSLGAGLLAGVVSLSTLAAGPWTYSCDVGSENSGYLTNFRSDYPVTGVPASVEVWAGFPQTQLTISDNQGSNTERLAGYKPALESVLNLTFYNRASLDNNIVRSVTWMGSLPINTPYAAQVPVSSLTSQNNLTFDFLSGCGKGYSNCVGLTIKSTSSSTGTFTMVEAARLTFGGSYTSPVTMTSLNFASPPPNEYKEHSIYFHYDIIGFYEGYSAPVNISGIPGSKMTPPAFAVMSKVTCTRAATPLTLTLGAPQIDFGSVLHGSSTPVTRELNWTATGTGQASIWTMAFDTTADKKDGNNIFLGNAKVKVLDSAGTQVPLGTPVNISGVTGTYTFELDPTGATPGEPSADVNVTLTAN